MTRKVSEVVDALVKVLQDHWEEFGMLDRDQVFFGDEYRYPKVPAIAVDPGPRESPLSATGLMQTNTFTVYILVYSARISGDVQALKRDNATLAEKVEDVVNANNTLGGLIIHGHVVMFEPGQASVGGELFAATRLTYTATTRTVVNSA